MTTIDFKGKTYELKRDINFAELIQIGDIQEQAQQFEGDEAQKSKEFEKVAVKNLKLIATILHDTLGLGTKDMGAFSVLEGFQLFNLVIERSSKPEKN